MKFVYVRGGKRKNTSVFLIQFLTLTPLNFHSFVFWGLGFFLETTSDLRLNRSNTLQS